MSSQYRFVVERCIVSARTTKPIKRETLNPLGDHLDAAKAILRGDHDIALKMIETRPWHWIIYRLTDPNGKEFAKTTRGNPTKLRWKKRLPNFSLIKGDSK